MESIMDFVYQAAPARVAFGAGSLQHLEREISLLGAQRALVPCTPEQREGAEAIMGRLGARGAGLFDRAVMHVPIATARAAREAAQACHADCAIAFGGGSTIGLGEGDCAGKRHSHPGNSHHLFRQRDDADLRCHGRRHEAHRQRQEGVAQAVIYDPDLTDVDVAAAYRCFVTRIVEDDSLGEPGIWGNSVGGLWAAATAATDDRIRACCVNGALAAPTLLPFRTFTEQAAAMLGNDDETAIRRNFERMRFRADRDRISCPLLVLHGGADPLVRLEDQQPFLDAAASEDVTLRIWPDGEHALYNHAAERTALVCDWFAERLGRANRQQG